jgi:predicted nucleotidyltransferase
MELIQRLRATVDSWRTPPAHASLFGSAARGDGDTGSDIDLFIVRPAEADADDPSWSEQVDGLAELVRAWTGNNAGIVEVSADELDELRGDPPSVIAELRRDAIDLGGVSARSLLGAL